MSDVHAQIAERAGAIATTEKSDKPTVAQLLDVQKREIAKALPTGMTAERFARVTLTEVKRTPKLRQCTAESLLGAVMLAAQLGLEPGPMQLSYLVPRRNKGTWEVQFQIGYRGMIDLAMRSGQVLDVAAHVVYETDEFDWQQGTSPSLHHRPSLDDDKGAVICAYAVARFVTGGAAFEVLSPREIERRRARGAAADSGPWSTDWPAMARKTAVRALEPYLPRSVELAQAARFDGAVVTDFTSRAIVETDPDADVIDVEDDETANQGADEDGPVQDGSGETGETAPVGSLDAGEPQAAGAPEPGPAEPESAPATEGDGDGGGSSAPSPEPTPEQIAIGTARREVAIYRNMKAAGATAKQNALDAWLNDHAIAMDLEDLDASSAVELIEYLAKHPIGKRRGDV